MCAREQGVQGIWFWWQIESAANELDPPHTHTHNTAEYTEENYSRGRVWGSVRSDVRSTMRHKYHHNSGVGRFVKLGGGELGEPVAPTATPVWCLLLIYGCDVVYGGAKTV